MVQKPQKTRIVALVKGVPRRLLSVTENSDGRLIISLSMTKIAFEQGARAETSDNTQQQKYTVHLSGKWRGNSIHHTLVHENRPTEETYIDTLAIANGLVEPLYVHMHRDLNYKSAIVPESNKERVVVVSSYEPSYSTLHTLVLLAPKDADIEFVGRSQSYQRHIVRFREFSLIVLESYTWIPSHDEGNITHLASKPKIIGGEGRGGEYPPMPGVDKMDARDCCRDLLYHSHELAFEIAERKLTVNEPLSVDMREGFQLTKRIGLRPFPYYGREQR